MNNENYNNTKKAYSKVSKQNAQHLLKFVNDDGISIKDAAKQLCISYDNARKIIGKSKKLSNDGDNSGKEAPGRKTLLTSEVLDGIEAIVEENSSYTIEDIRRLLNERKGVTLSKSTVDNGLRSLMITLKRGSLVLDRVNSDETIERRMRYASMFTSESPEDKAKCIFIDESGFNYHMTRGQARSKRGARAFVPVPTIRGRMQTLILAASQRGVLHYKLISDSTCNGSVFLEFIREVIEIINSDQNMRGSWLILDNARIHGTQDVKNLVTASGHRLVFLSPYSYMLNPVEQIFSKIKLAVRSMISDNFRNGLVLNMKDLIDDAIPSITSQDCVNYVIHMMRNISLSLQGHTFG